jgi:hypothetical protein
MQLSRVFDSSHAYLGRKGLLKAQQLMVHPNPKEKRSL